MNKPILQDGVSDIDTFLKRIKENFSRGEQPKINIVGCSCLTYDCENCSIEQL